MKVFKIAQVLVRKVKETKTYIKYQDFKAEMLNQKMNRTLIGEDRLGNKYYQYYSPYGLPHRREVEFIDKTSYALNDQAFWLWLNNKDEASPTKEEVERYYFEEAMRIQRGIEWDTKEQLMMQQFYDQRKQLLEQQMNKHKKQNENLLTQDEIDQEQKQLSQQILNEEFEKDPRTHIPESVIEEQDQVYKPQTWNPANKNKRSRFQ